MFIEQPPEDLPEHIKSYINRMFREIQTSIDGVNAIVIRDQVPDRPREGTIYYLREDLDIAVEGYYAWLNDAWHKIDTTEGGGSPT